MATAELALGTITICESLNEFWQSLPFQVLFVGHALYCTVAGSEFKNRWLLHLLLTYLWGNGGGIITAALIMQPKYATWTFFNDFIVGTWIVCWWLTNHSPGGIPGKLMNVWWIKMLCKSCTMLSRAQLIVSRVNLAVQLYPGSVAPALILGTLAGCGGRLLADGIMTGWQSMPGLAELTSPGFVSRSAAFAAVSYYTLAYVTQLLPAQAAAGLVITALMLHTIASDLAGLPLDFTDPVTQLLHTVTLVPVPPPQPQPAPVTVALKRVTPGKQQPAAAASSPAGKKTPAKSPAKQSPAPQQCTPSAAAVVAAAASPVASGSARKRRGKAADAAAEDEVAGAALDFSSDGAGAAEEAQRSQPTRSRRSIAPDAGGAAGSGVTTRRRAAAAVYA